MSTFAVFGMTHERARELARVRVDRAIVSERKYVPPPDREKRVADEADTIMKSSQVVQLSDKFDAPQFAEDFLRLTERTQEHRSLRIKAWTKADGLTKSGRQKMEWQPVDRSATA